MQIQDSLPLVHPRHHALKALLLAGALLAVVSIACDRAAGPQELTPGPTPTREAEPTRTPMPQPTGQAIPSPTPTVPAPTPLQEARQTATPPAPTRPAVVTPEAGEPSDSDARYIQVSAGSVHTCGLRADGTIICWGAGDEYEGRTGATGLLDSPPGSFTHIDTGYYHSCAVGRDGIVECWGGSYSDDDDALLTPEERAMKRTLLGPPEGRFISVSVGLWLDCGVRVDNSAECWGLGPATSDELKPPHGKYTSVSVGDFHACGIRIDQTVVCWGSNEGFDGDFLGQATPPDGPFEVIDAEAFHTCGFRPDGEIRCWGSIVGGVDGEVQVCEQQPDGTTECRVDEEVTAAHRAWGGWPGGAPDGDLKAIDGDQDFSCALWDGGHIVCWGSGGINGAPPQGIFTAVTVGHDHGCGLRPDGSVECWGEDNFGEASPPDATAPGEN